jgi:hypothetical protein
MDSFDGLNPIAGVYPFAGFNNCLPRPEMCYFVSLSQHHRTALPILDSCSKAR